MNHFPLCKIAIAGLLLLSLAKSSHAATPAIEVGENDFRISFMGPEGSLSYAASWQSTVSHPERNELLVVWAASDDTGDLTVNETEIYAQRLSSDTFKALDGRIRLSFTGPDGDGELGAFVPRATFDSRRGEYFVVWAAREVGFGAAETEIFGRRIDADTSIPIGPQFQISEPGISANGYPAFRPDVAYNAEADEYLVVWRGSSPRFGQSSSDVEILGQRLAAGGGGPLGELMSLSDMGGMEGDTFRAFDPRVIYISQSDQYFVVWHGDDDIGGLLNEEFEIFLQRVDASNGAELGPNDQRISDMAGIGKTIQFTALRPALVHNPQEGEVLVVWEGDDNQDGGVDDEIDVFGQRLDATTGEEIGGDFRISNMGGSTGDPTYDGSGADVGYVAGLNQYVVAWHGNDDQAELAEFESEVYFRCLDGSTAVPLGTSHQRITDIGLPRNTSYFGQYPTLGVSGSRLLAAYQSRERIRGDPPYDEREIFGQFLELPLFSDGFESGNTAAWQ